MFKEGDTATYVHFSWADEETIREKVRIVHVIDNGEKYYIENTAGTIRRTVRAEELESKQSPFGQII